MVYTRLNRPISAFYNIAVTTKDSSMARNSVKLGTSTSRLVGYLDVTIRHQGGLHGRCEPVSVPLVTDRL